MCTHTTQCTKQYRTHLHLSALHVALDSHGSVTRSVVGVQQIVTCVDVDGKNRVYRFNDPTVIERHRALEHEDAHDEGQSTRHECLEYTHNEQCIRSMCCVPAAGRVRVAVWWHTLVNGSRAVAVHCFLRATTGRDQVQWEDQIVPNEVRDRHIVARAADKRYKTIVST